MALSPISRKQNTREWEALDKIIVAGFRDRRFREAGKLVSLLH